MEQQNHMYQTSTTTNTQETPIEHAPLKDTGPIKTQKRRKNDIQVHAPPENMKTKKSSMTTTTNKHIDLARKLEKTRDNTIHRKMTITKVTDTMDGIRIGRYAADAINEVTSGENVHRNLGTLTTTTQKEVTVNHDKIP